MTGAVLAALAVVDLVAVADVEAIKGAIAPNGMLDEPGEGCGKSWVEPVGINQRRRIANEVGAASWLIAGRPIGVVGMATGQDAGAMKEVMDQGVDHGGACTQGKPFGPISGEQ